MRATDTDFAISSNDEEHFFRKIVSPEKGASLKRENCRFSEPKMPVREQNGSVAVSVGGGSFRGYCGLEKGLLVD